MRAIRSPRLGAFGGAKEVICGEPSSQSTPTVHVVGYGGTIASEPAADGAAPAKAGAELVDAVPAVSEHVDLRVTDVGSRPGFDMDFGVVAAAEAVRDAAASVPVVVSSRCHAGPTEAVYGTAGGGVTLRDHGVAYAGDLSTAKARVKLVLGLTAGLSRKAVEATFE